MKMASSHVDNTTQGNASLICIWRPFIRENVGLDAARARTGGTQADDFLLKRTCSKARNWAPVGASKSYLCRAHERLRELLRKTAHEPATAEAKGSGLARCRSLVTWPIFCVSGTAKSPRFEDSA